MECTVSFFFYRRGRNYACGYPNINICYDVFMV